MQQNKDLNFHFQGRKQQYRILFDYLRHKIEDLGPDVLMKVRKGYIAFSRNRCFAVVYIKLSHIYLEFAASPSLYNNRLRKVDSLRSKGQIHYGIKLNNHGEINQELVNYLKQSYDLS